jgi:SulP family sulfate permease
VLAVSGATVALAFVFQWLLGVLRWRRWRVFLPISVTHGFAAGVGLSMVVGQVRSGFGSGGRRAVATCAPAGTLLAALAVVGLAWWLRGRWPRMPGLLTAVAVVALAVALAAVWGMGLGACLFRPCSPVRFAGPLWPDWTGIPWMALAQQQGQALVVLALLMALVNSLEILVFNQELELDHGLRGNANAPAPREPAGYGVRAGRHDSRIHQRLALAHCAGPGGAKAPRPALARRHHAGGGADRALVAALGAHGLPVRRVGAGRA